MATHSYWLWSLLLLCFSSACRLPQAGINSSYAEEGHPSSFVYDASAVDSPAQDAEVLRLIDAVKPAVPVKAIPESQSIAEVYTSQLGIREATGHNDGKSVEMYLQSVGLGRGYPWCAAFVRWCYDSAHIVTTINGAAASAHRPQNLVLFQHKFLKEPQSGDAFTLWYPSLHRIGHTGFYHKRVNESVYQSVEGNTNEAGSREGDGVYKKYRSFNATYSISRWTKS
jgi:hypothetical protein